MDSLDRIASADAVTRLRGRDASLFSPDAAEQQLIAERLGWTHLASESADTVGAVRALAEAVRAEGLTDVVLLGMGGSSLASLVIGAVANRSSVRLRVLDTTDPATVLATLSEIDPASTLVVVASKSGGTIEPNALYAIVRPRFDEALGAAAGARFVAVTDPGTSLEALAQADGFRCALASPPAVGGRFSALTVFGLLTAALLDADLDGLLDAAADMEAACDLPAHENPAAGLAAFIADAHFAHRDKLTFVSSPGLETFGLWGEQLVAESLGKRNTGVVPVVDLSAGHPEELGEDRAIAVVRYASDEKLARWAAGIAEHHPVFETVLEDPEDLFAAFVCWEHAVALVGFLIGVNPFDEPNVAEAKAATAAVLEGAPVPEPTVTVEGVACTMTGALPPHRSVETLADVVGVATGALGRNDFLAVLAYLPQEPVFDVLGPAIPALSASTGAAVCLELGPRYLHSTGQLHKGGANQGVFLVVTARGGADMAVPGKPWTLRELYRAQAQGDLVTLAAHGRRAIWLDLPDGSAAHVDALAAALRDAGRR